jgi:hypothetical protein
MHIRMNRLSVVVADFVASLSEERKAELQNNFFSNEMLTTDWQWYKEVIDRYLKGPDAQALMDDIELHHPGADFGNAIRENPRIHLYEADIILQETRKAIAKPPR